MQFVHPVLQEVVGGVKVIVDDGVVKVAPVHLFDGLTVLHCLDVDLFLSGKVNKMLKLTPNFLVSMVRILSIQIHFCND